MAKKSFHLDNIVWAWLPIGMTVTLLCGLMYVLVQQDIRQSANDPQIQIAQDAAAYLETGGSAQTMIASVPKVDIANSLAVYMIIYDDKGTVLASSAQLDGKTPELPMGVLDYAREHVQHRITWQPKPGVRSAAVIVRYVDGTHGFVLVGRSLREIEDRKMYLLFKVIIGWAVTLVGTLFVSAVVRFRE